MFLLHKIACRSNNTCQLFSSAVLSKTKLLLVVSLEMYIVHLMFAVFCCNLSANVTLALPL